MPAGRVRMSARTRVIAAVIAGESSAMDGAALAVKSAAVGLALKHRNTGAYIDAIEIHSVPGERGTGKNVRDRVVSATDPASNVIEWGRIYRHPGSRRVTYEPGQHIMTNALHMVN